MLVTTTTTEPSSGPPSRTPSILDSPTLARVERARLRLEASKHGSSNGIGSGNVGLVGGLQSGCEPRREDSLERSILDPKVSVCCVTAMDEFLMEVDLRDKLELTYF